MAITKVGTDVTSTNGSAVPLQFSHTLVAGSNRLIVVSVGCENANDPGTWTITYGGQTCTISANAQQGTGFANNAIVAILKEADLPSNGSNQVSITFSGTAGSLEISASCAQYAGVDQTGPSDTDTTVQTTGTQIINDVTVATGDLVVSAVSAGNAASGGFTQGQSQTEIFDYNDTSSVACTTELIATGSLSQVDSTFSGTVNRLARGAAVFEEAAAGPTITDVSPDDPLRMDQSSVTITGSGFEASQ